MQKKEIPLLYSGEMVRAKLAGRKTETRRIIKPQPIVDKDSGYVYDGKHKSLYKNDALHEDWRKQFVEDHAKFKQGDLIWGRENYSIDPNADSEQKIVFRANNEGVVYPLLKTIPCIHMQKSIARIWDEVIEVRVERLWDITHDGVIAEGIIKDCKDGKPTKYGLDAWAYDEWCFTAKFAYKQLWGQINGVVSWKMNPWVWVIVTKQLSVTGRPEGV